MEVSYNSPLHLSPFRPKVREFQDSDINGKDFSLPSGSSIRDYIDRVYKLRAKSTELPLRANFTTRDNKAKTYDPAKEDPFFIADHAGVALAKSVFIEYISFLSDLWAKAGLPLKSDKDRGLASPVPDLELLSTQYLSVDSKMKLSSADLARIYSLSGDVDISLKFNIIRRVLPGWFAVNYSAKEKPISSVVSQSIKAHAEAARIIMNSDMYKKMFQSVIDAQGMPLDTGVGSPLFTAEFKDDTPISKLKVLTMFENIGTGCLVDSDAITKALSQRLAKTEMKDYPLAFQPIRRSQYGYKWQHVWKPSSVGFQSVCDIRGPNTTRVAWGPPYYFNLMLAPIQAYFKTLRYCMPGLIHDGPSKTSYLKKFRDNPSIIMVENDYSNYDRSISPSIIKQFWTEMLAPFGSAGSKALNLLMYTVENATLLMPSQFGEESSALAVQPAHVGLLSGLFDTSERGTFYNSVMCGASILDSGIMSYNGYVDYLTSLSKGKDVLPVYLVQSDDTLLVTEDITSMRKLVQSFVKVTGAVGLKSEPLLGDRFLMRHMFRGSDTPVAARVLQNTISAEDPKTDPIIVEMGLMSRTDGFGKFRSIDAFGLGHNVAQVSRESIMLQAKAIELIQKLRKQKTVLKDDRLDAILILLQKLISYALAADTYSPELARELDDLRKRVAVDLAARELEMMKKTGTSSASYLMEAYRNRYSASGAAMINFFSSLHPTLAKSINQIGSRESQFLSFALKTLNWPRDIKDL